MKTKQTKMKNIAKQSKNMKIIPKNRETSGESEKNQKIKKSKKYRKNQILENSEPKKIVERKRAIFAEYVCPEQKIFKNKNKNKLNK